MSTVYKEIGDRVAASGSYSYAYQSRNKPPVLSRPLPYTAGYVTSRLGVTSEGKPSPFDARNVVPFVNGYALNSVVIDDFEAYRIANNKALDKLYERFDQQADLVVAFIEREEALKMAINAFKGLQTAYRLVVKRDPRLIRKVFTYQKVDWNSRRQGKKAAEDLTKVISEPAGVWLGYWFGLRPLFMDLQHAAGILQRDFPTLDLSVSSGEKFNQPYPPITESYHWYTRGSGQVIAKLGCEAYAKNPLQALASQLGLMSPLSAINELVPFSWALGYVTNYAQLLKNLEPRFPGFEVINTYNTLFVKGEGEHLYNGYVKTFYTYKYAYVRRQLGLPYYKHVTSSLTSIHAQQASYLAAVTAQLFAGGMKKRIV